jgi:diaminopimelate epimerase
MIPSTIITVPSGGNNNNEAVAPFRVRKMGNQYPMYVDGAKKSCYFGDVGCGHAVCVQETIQSYQAGTL